MATYKIKRLAGRCADGAERDGGTRWHAVGPDDRGFYWKALCGATYGRRSAGWSVHEGTDVTCPRCLKRLASADPPVSQNPTKE